MRGTVPPEGAAALPGTRIDLLPEITRPAADDEPAPTPEQIALDQGFMPNWRGFPWEEAVRFMQGSGFHTPVRFVYALDVDAELVIATDPRAGTALATDLVQFWVSEGPGPREPFTPPTPDKPIPIDPPIDFVEPIPKPDSF